MKHLLTHTRSRRVLSAFYASFMIVSLLTLNFPVATALAEEGTPAETPVVEVTTTSDDSNDGVDAPADDSSESGESAEDEKKPEEVKKSQVSDEGDTEGAQSDDGDGEEDSEEPQSFQFEQIDTQLTTEFNIHPQPKTLTVQKVVVNDEGGNATADSFSFTLETYQGFFPLGSWDEVGTYQFDADGENELPMPKKPYRVTETAHAGYEADYSNNCTEIVNLGIFSKTCTVTNNDLEQQHPTGTLIVVKNIVGTSTSSSNFSFTVDKQGSEDSTNHQFEEDASNELTLETGAYDIVEDSAPGYTTTYTSDREGANAEHCDNIAIGADQTVTCTITNTYVPPAPQCDDDATFTVVSNGGELVDGTGSAVETWEHSAWIDEAGDGAKWIWATTEVENPSATTTHTFSETFTIIGTPLSGTLRIAADNGYAVTLNGQPVCSASPYSSHYASYTACAVPAELFVNGENTLSVEVVNASYATQDPHKNPAGVIYKLTVNENECEVPQPPISTASVTLCKVDQNDNPLPGWQLMLLGDHLDPAVTVLPNGNTYSKDNVPAGDYVVTADGQYVYRGTPGAEYSDAAYSLRDPADVSYLPDLVAPYWYRENDFVSPHTGWLGIIMNDSYTDWGSVFNPLHRYALGVSTASTQDFDFKILDDQYGDNSGSIDVNIYEGYIGYTDSEGCVTFDDVPYGEYALDEIQRDGWTRIDENQSVTVDEEQHVFTVVNDNGERPTSCVLVSDAMTLEGGTSSSLVTFFHNSWTAIIDGASWIWGEDPATDTVVGKTETFTKTFVLDAVPTSATLEIAADNGYVVTLNGVEIGADDEEQNYTAAGQDVYVLQSGDFLVGDVNVLEFTVDNYPLANGTYQTNPGGLLYKLTIDGTDCEQDVPLPRESEIIQPTVDEVTSGTTELEAYYADENGDGNDSVQWAVRAGTCAAGTNTVLGNVDGHNDPFTWDNENFIADFNTTLVPNGQYCFVFNPSEDSGNANQRLTRTFYVDNGSVQPETGTLTIVKNAIGGDATFDFVVGAEEWNPDITTTEGYGEDSTDLPVGEYTVSEIVPEGWDLTGAGCAIDNDDLQVGTVSEVDNSQDIVLGAGDHITCTFTNTKQSTGGDGQLTYYYATTTVEASDLAQNGGDVLSDITKWLFYNDETDTIDSSLGSFVSGPDTAPVGDGSVEITVAGSQRRNLATYQFSGTELANITELRFSTYNASATNGGSANRAGYLGFNVDFDGSDTWQRRINFVPANNGIVTQDAWDEWDAIQGGNAMWTYSGSVWPTTAVGPDAGVVGESGSTPRSWNDILADYPGVRVRVTDSWMGIRVGSPYADGYTENLDKFVIGIQSGSDVNVTTYDFEPTIEPENTFVDTNSGGSTRRNSPSGEVLGAATSTEPTCGPLLTQFLRLGKVNDAGEVTKLQTFLNTEMGSGLPVTGFFGKLTDTAVRAFQTKYWEDVLKPWFTVPGSGVTTKDDATGYVYKTTEWKINDIVCPNVAPFPALP